MQMWTVMRRRRRRGLPTCMSRMCGSLMRRARLFRVDVTGLQCGGAAASKPSMGGRWASCGSTRARTNDLPCRALTSGYSVDGESRRPRALPDRPFGQRMMLGRSRPRAPLPTPTPHERAVVVGDHQPLLPDRRGGSFHPSAEWLLTALRAGCQSQSRRRNMTNSVRARLVWTTTATTKPLVAPKPGYGTFMP